VALVARNTQLVLVDHYKLVLLVAPLQQHHHTRPDVPVHDPGGETDEVKPFVVRALGEPEGQMVVARLH